MGPREVVDRAGEHAVGADPVGPRYVEDHAARVGADGRRCLEGDLVNARCELTPVVRSQGDGIGERLRGPGERQAPDNGDDCETGLRCHLGSAASASGATGGRQGFDGGRQGRDGVGLRFRIGSGLRSGWLCGRGSGRGSGGRDRGGWGNRSGGCFRKGGRRGRLRRCQHGLICVPRHARARGPLTAMPSRVPWPRAGSGSSQRSARARRGPGAPATAGVASRRSQQPLRRGSRRRSAHPNCREHRGEGNGGPGQPEVCPGPAHLAGRLRDRLGARRLPRSGAATPPCSSSGLHSPMALSNRVRIPSRRCAAAAAPRSQGWSS